MKKMIKASITKSKSLLSKLPNIDNLYRQIDREQVQKYLIPTSHDSIIHRMKVANALGDDRFKYTVCDSVETLTFINDDYLLRIEVEHIKLEYPSELPCTIIVSYHSKVMDGQLVLLGYSSTIGDGHNGFIWNVERRIWCDLIITNILRFIYVADQKREAIHNAVREGFKSQIDEEISRRNNEDKKMKLRQKEEDLISRIYEVHGGKWLDV